MRCPPPVAIATDEVIEVIMLTGGQNADFNARFFPLQLTLLSVGENIMPMAYWQVISKDPFRFLLCMQKGNHTLGLLRNLGEAALNFMPWEERDRVVQAGHLSGRDVNKAEKLGFTLLPAEKLTQTRLVEGYENCFETVLRQELEGLSHEFALFVMDVVATHGNVKPKRRHPILYLSGKDFATTGEGWRYNR